uniref:Zinc finger PHD-type domain-containing protein n=1 Tax=Mycena chlorophos TaxID=658473 RepID=A0ABQ0LTS0_MYCCL|nr:predicted protein [Mycena chlorophos]
MGQAISTLTSRLASKILEYAAAHQISHHTTVHPRIGCANLTVEKPVKMENQEQLQNPLNENMNCIPSTPRKNSSKVYTFNMHGGTGGSGGKGGQEGGAGGVGQGPRIIINACGDRILTTAPSSPVHQNKSSICYDCPPPSKFFQGRGDALDQLAQYFDRKNNEQIVVLLHGLGGAGKTQTALKFLAKYSERFTDQFKIDASNIETISEGYKSICRAKNLDISVEAAHAWLQNNEDNWIILFDNAAVDLNLGNYIPKSEHGNVLITSRDPYHGIHTGPSRRTIGLSDLNEEDAINLLIGIGGIDTSQNNNQALVRELVNLCSFLHFHGITEDIFKRADSYVHEGYAGIMVPGHLSRSIDYLATFHDANDNWDTYAFRQVIGDLCKYSLMNWSENSYSIHPLVQEWTRETAPDAEHQKRLIVDILSMCAASNPEFWVKEQLPLLPHLLSIEDDELLGAAGLSITFTKIYAVGRLFQRSVEVGTAGLREAIKYLGREHHLTIEMMLVLAWAYWSLGLYEEAQDLEEQVLDIYLHKYGKTHPDTIEAMAHLAATYKELDMHDEAKKLESQVLEHRTRLLVKGQKRTWQDMITENENIICSNPHCWETQDLPIVQCSSQDCRAKYHLSCVGLTTAPKKSWFCDEGCARQSATARPVKRRKY